MQGVKPAQDGLFVYGSLDSMVPADDPYRRLDALLDLAWVRQETRRLYSWTGRPSIDPVVIAKLLLIAYMEGITSERELLRQVHVNLSFRRFLGYRLDEALPDHSALSRARYRLGQPFSQKLFEYVLSLCLDAGLVGGEHQSIDSTFVQANASLASLRPRLVPLAARDFTERLFEENPVEEEKAKGSSSGRGGGGGRCNDAFVSRTDPDCGLKRRGGGEARLGYLVHYSVDRLKQVITGVRTTAAHIPDSSQIVPLVDQIRKRGIPVRSVAADKGYSAGAVYQALDEQGVEGFIPMPEKRGERRGRFSQQDFTYEPVGDRFLCPAGKALPLVRVDPKGGGRQYRARPGDCQTCPLRERCTDARARTLRISPYHEHLERARQRLRTPAARRAAIARRTGPERLFAEGKGCHGLARAHYRGQANMEQQALLTATVQNLRRYVQAQTRAFSGAAALRVASAFELVSRIGSVLHHLSRLVGLRRRESRPPLAAVGAM